jgi:hypothetical protein
VEIWYIFPVLVFCAKKNLATLVGRHLTTTIIGRRMLSYDKIGIGPNPVAHQEPIFRTFFRGKFRGKFSSKKCWKKLEFSAEKVLKNRFSNKFHGIFRGKKCMKNRTLT